MTTDANRATDTSTAQDPGAAPRTPWTVDGARLLRVVAGVDERLLDLVPTVRPRYTSLGVLVVGTATLGAMSMALRADEKDLQNQVDTSHPLGSLNDRLATCAIRSPSSAVPSRPAPTPSKPPATRSWPTGCSS